MPSHFESELNAAQADAVAHVDGPLLVFAGAGSGKTRVITYRIANLVACEHVPPHRILAVTFTNKAAAEMRSRLDALLGEGLARELWVGTFHATCARLLRVHGAAVGLPRSFTIYDSADQKAVVQRAMKELDLDDKRFPLRTLLSRIQKEKQEARGPEQMSLDSYIDEVVRKVYDRYEEQLKRAHAVDFEDLILYVVRLLEDDKLPDGRAIRRRFDFVLVDEFQDTNHTQYRLLRSLVREHGNLCVVGDDDQSIYRWRGADVRNIRGFRKDFRGATVVKLEQNYRSSARIVAAALGVISRSAEREPKALWTANDDGALVDVVAVADERDEAAHVTSVIQKARADGVDAKEIAVFYRVHAQSRVLEEALRSVDIPYQIVGGTKFYERAEIKDALSYLRLIVNPSADVDLLRVVNTPARGLGQTTVDRLVAFATEHRVSLFETLDRCGDITTIAPAAKKKLVAFRNLVCGLQAAAAEGTPSSTLRTVLDATGYRKALLAEDSPEADARMENLDELVSSVLDFEVEAQAAGEAPTLDGYLERISLAADVDAMKDGGRVTLMTVHGAKGLEFELVVVTGLEEDLFPYRTQDPSQADDQGARLEEERRLGYVAITRARKKLILTYTQLRQIFGKTRVAGPSRFLGELPREHVAFLSSAQLGRRPRFLDTPSFVSEKTPAQPWRHPQAGAPAAAPLPSPPGRYVDREFFDDASDVGALRRGSVVLHDRFGRGEVRSVELRGEPSVVAFFPGWGEKKILARFLKNEA